MKLGREVSRHNELDNWRNTHRFESVMATKWLLLTISETEPGLWDRLLSPQYSPVEGLWERSPLAEKIAEVAGGSFKHREPPEIRGTGYVVDSMEAALWAFHKSQDFREGALLAANLGDDADTTAAIYGQIAGAHYGAAAIPAAWRELLTMATEITSMADKLYGHARESMATKLNEEDES